jgi:Domain of unknown function (DUF4105)
LVLHNVRNFDYRSETDFTPRWETRTYDLAHLTGLDLVMSYWGSPWIAHTILSRTFADGPPLAISIETRRERAETYSALRGFFREYEIYYVAADERDLVRLRTNYRGEEVYLYRLATPPDRGALLLDYVKSMNALRDRPAWYKRSPTTARRASGRTRRRSEGSRRSTGAWSSTVAPIRCSTSAARWTPACRSRSSGRHASSIRKHRRRP